MQTRRRGQPRDTGADNDHPSHRRDHLANQTTMPHQSMNGQPRTLRSPGRAITKMKLAETVQEAIDRTTEEPAASSETGRGKVPTTLTAKGRRPR